MSPVKEFDVLRKYDSGAIDALEEDKVIQGNSLKSLDSIVRLKSNKELKGVFEQFQEVFGAMMKGDFSKRMTLSNRKNLFTYFGLAVNSVNEELETNVVKTHYLESTLECIPDMAFVTDKYGKIIFANSIVTSFFKIRKEEILNLSIQQIIEFGIKIIQQAGEEEMIEATISFNNLSSKILIKEKKVFDIMGEHDGYIYIAQDVLTGTYKIKNLSNRYIIK